MHEALTCNVCDHPGSFEQASEVGTIRCNVRKFGTESFTVWRCPHCLSLHCKETVDLDAYYIGYPMRTQSLDFATLRAYHNRLRVMRKHGLKAEHSILDYGCSTGLFVDFLKARGHNARGYDPYVSEFSDRGILDGRFDFIVTQDVIEHVSEPRELVAEYSRLLKKEGKLFIGTPNASEIELDERYSMELHQPYHRHILSESALTALCKGAGLQLVTIDHRFYYDTLYPMVNTQFIKRYIRRTGDFLDAGFEEPRVGLVLTSPELLFFGFFGYFFRARGNMVAVFQRAD